MALEGTPDLAHSFGFLEPNTKRQTMNRILSLAAVFLIALSSVAFAAQGSFNNTSDQKIHKNSRGYHSAASGTSGNRYGY